MFFRRKKNDASEKPTGRAAAAKPTGADAPVPREWRSVYNPNGDASDVVAYGASVAEGRIAGKYQLSNTRIPPTVIVQRTARPAVIVGADVSLDRETAEREGIDLVRTQREGRNAARTVGTINLSELMARAPRTFAAATVEPDSPATILYTSGTTGNPKGVTLTHRNFHFQLDIVARSIVDFSMDDRIMGVLPMYHVFGLANSLVAAITYGASIILVAQYSPNALLESIAQNEATILTAVPSMYQHLLAAARVRKTSIPSSLRLCVSGGAALPMSVLQSFMDTFQTKIVEGYGLTETTSSVCANGRNGRFKDGSIGPPADGVEMAVLDDEGNPVADGEQGEIAIRSATVFAGYWNDPEATAAVLDDDGWFRTGDLGYRDAEGDFFITDRKKDIIITGGYNVSPREVEEVLMAHPAIADAAVVGMIGRRKDAETIHAFIVLHEGESLTERGVADYCEQELASYKRPQVIQFVDTLPKSATGKVLRTQLRGELVDRRLVGRGAEGGQPAADSTIPTPEGEAQS